MKSVVSAEDDNVVVETCAYTRKYQMHVFVIEF